MMEHDNVKTLQSEVERLKKALEEACVLESEAEESRRAMLFMLEDLEESQSSIKRVKQEWVNAFDAVDDPIFIHDAEFCLVRANRAYAAYAGAPIESIIGRPYYECFPKSDGPMVSCLHRVSQTGLGAEVEELELDSGELFLSRAFVIRDDKDNYVHSIHILQNVTEQRRAEQALRDSEEYSRTIVESSVDCIKILDLDGTLLSINRGGQELMGIGDITPYLGTSWVDSWQEEDREVATSVLVKATAGETGRFSAYAPSLRGEPLWWNVVVSPIRDAEGRILRLLSVARDITENKLSQQRLTDNEEKLCAVTSTAQDAIFMVDQQGCIRYNNPAAERLFGYCKEELLGKDVHGLITPQRYRDAAHKGFKNFIKTGVGRIVGKTVELEALHKNGSEFPIELSISATKVKGQLAAVGFVRDISERHEMEQKLLRENRARRVIGASNSMLVHAVNEVDLLQEICNLIVAERDYPLAWVTLVDEVDVPQYSVAAHAGVIDEEDIDNLSRNGQNMHGRVPASVVIRECRRQLITDAQHNPACKTCQKLAIKHDYNSILTFPLMQNQDCFGALTISALGSEHFSSEEIGLLQGLADDLSYGVVALRVGKARDQAELEQRQTLEKLKTNLNTTVQAMADAVEVRDPYTAGHQRHVAALATAIATEMGLSEHEVEGIRIAATIHDLGKIYVPAEILSKPGRISPIEFELIKTHSQVGYDILKNIDFPWSVASMVWQHHERLDGSGYPQGLKGNEIELGAKIIGVADVTEAIAAHRPYRASLGIDFALETVEKDSGTTFEPDVVDACLRLFREKGYSLDLG